MRSLVIIGLFISVQGWAQIMLSGVKVNIEESETAFLVRATYRLEIPEDVNELKLKALRFKGAQIHEFKINMIETIVDPSIDLITVDLAINNKQKPDSITLQYRVKPGEKGEIPLFFGDWQSASSDQNFFEFQMIADQSTNVLFPAENQVNDQSPIRVIGAALPAATSMIRIEQGSNAGTQWIRRVDQMVIALFIIIGLLIWFNRKRLVYG